MRFREPVSNAGWSFAPLGDDNAERERLRSEEGVASADALERRLEQLKMKGYRLLKAGQTGQTEVKVDAGSWVLDEGGLRRSGA